MKDQMTYDEFVAKLPRIDWYYNMSDDPRAYREGMAQVERYRQIAEENGTEWVEAFEVQNKKHTIR